MRALTNLRRNQGMLAENICMKMDGIIAMEDGDIHKVHLQL